jgi:hypothetical protein
MFTGRFCMTLTHISRQRVFTDADIRTSGMVANIGKAVEKAYQEVGNAGKQKVILWLAQRMR